MIAIFYALEAEIKDLKKGRECCVPSVHGDCRVNRVRINSKEIFLVATGVGKERALAAVEHVLEGYPVSKVISTGFAGALNDKTNAGDVVIASRLEVEKAKPDERQLIADSNLVMAAQRIQDGKGFRALAGTGVTVGEVCATPTAKRQICANFKADFVDMESYWIGRAAAEKNLPFLTVRAVSDSVLDDLSFIGEVTSEGRVLPGKIVRRFISHPGDLPRAVGLSAQIGKAGRNLAWFLDRLIDEIGFDE
jgi:adenosylhomocysteine nucleosidase